MALSVALFLAGVLGFALNRKSVLLMLIAVEVMLLGGTLLVALSALQFEDAQGQAYAVYVIAVAGAESAVGLALLVAFYRLRGSIRVH
jgi:NADH-ubiquinone oxidoreductase chain 4L